MTTLKAMTYIFYLCHLPRRGPSTRPALRKRRAGLAQDDKLENNKQRSAEDGATRNSVFALDPHFFRLGAGFDHLNDALAGRRFVLTRGRQPSVDGEIMRACHQQLFSRKAGDDFVAGLSDDDFLFDSGRAPSIS